MASNDAITTSVLTQIGNSLNKPEDLIHTPLFVIGNNEIWLWEIIAFCVIIALDFIIVSLITKRIKKRYLSKLNIADKAMGIILSVISWSIFVLIFLATLRIFDIHPFPFISTIWNMPLFTVGKRTLHINQLVVAILFAVFGYMALRRFTAVLRDNILPHLGLHRSAAISLSKIIFYSANFLIIIIVLALLSIDITMFAFLGGAVAIAAGFGAQNILNNFTSGIILLIERPIRVGDLVEFGNNRGTIEEITARCTHLKTPENIHLLIPNSHLLENIVINWSFSDRCVRSSVFVGVAYGSPVKEVMKLLEQAADENEKVLKSPAPYVFFIDFGDNALTFQLNFWILVNEILDRLKTESDLRVRIDELFREANITIAFPQRDVHLNSLSPLDVRIIPDKPSDEK